jgi:CheY-like chemotaxis protein
MELLQAIANTHPCAVVQVSGTCGGAVTPAAGLVSLPGIPLVSLSLPGLTKAAHHHCLSDHLVKPISRRKLAEALGRVARDGKKIQRVVIVEDEAPMREFLRLSVGVIVGQPVDIVEVDSCHAAIEAAAANKPDVVLLDLILPDGDGLGLAAELHQRFGDDLPLIAITARDPRNGECETAPDAIICTRLKRFSQREIESLLNGVLTSFSSGLALDSAESTSESRPASGRSGDAARAS